MTNILEQVILSCPYCGEPLNAALRHVETARDYSSDCPVCFCPVVFRVTAVLDGRFQRVLAIRDGTTQPA